MLSSPECDLGWPLFALSPNGSGLLRVRERVSMTGVIIDAHGSSNEEEEGDWAAVHASQRWDLVDDPKTWTICLACRGERKDSAICLSVHLTACLPVCLSLRSLISHRRHGWARALYSHLDVPRLLTPALYSRPSGGVAGVHVVSSTVAAGRPRLVSYRITWNPHPWGTPSGPS